MQPLHRVVSLVVTLACVLAGTAAFAQAPHTHRHSFSDAHKWARVFDDPRRDEWQKPLDVIRALALREDAIVADIGAGTGYFATRLARQLPQGRVYATDTEPDMVRYLADRARSEALSNLRPLAAAAGEPKLPEAVDLVILVDVYHHIDRRDRYLEALRGALKAGGRIAIIDFRLDSPVGPPRGARIEPERVKAEFERAGYVLRDEHGFLPHQYFLVFAPRDR